jgi:hypothetical protein
MLMPDADAMHRSAAAAAIRVTDAG